VTLQHIQPDHKTVAISGAFRVDEASLRRFIALAQPHLGSPVQVQYVLEEQDGAKTISPDPAALENFGLHHLRSRKTFSVEVRFTQGYNTSSISLFYDLKGGMFDRARIFIYNTPNATSMEGQMRDYLVGTRVWYSWLYSMVLGYMIIIGAAINVGLFIGQLTTRASFSSIEIIISAAIVLAYLITSPLRWFLFSRVAIMFGEERARQERLVTARRVVFGTLLVGLLVAAVGGLSTGFFSGLFAHISDHHA
jgi:hypothetical protein